MVLILLVAAAVHAANAAALERPPRQQEAETDDPRGDLLILGGGEWPQGSTTQFSDEGWNLNARIAAHLPFLKGVIPTMGLSGTFFPSESGLVEDETENFIVIAKEESDRWAGSLNIGLQLGSPSRRGFFRPRAGIAPGFYLLGKDTNRKLPQDPEPYYEKSLLLGRLGWKGVVGADFFFSRKWGIAIEYVYDQVWDLENGASGRYQGFAAGVSFAIDQLEEAPSEPADEEPPPEPANEEPPPEPSGEDQGE